MTPSKSDRCMRNQDPVVVGSTVHVPLFGGRFTIIDLCDYSVVANDLWSVNVHGYAQRSRGELLHLCIFGRRDRMVVDHVNRNRLDNRRSNLRFCTRAQNVVNAKKPVTNTSGFKGVTWDKAKRRWKAQVYHCGKNVFIGNFGSKHEAAAAYDRTVTMLHGEYATTNSSLLSGSVGEKTA